MKKYIIFLLLISINVFGWKVKTHVSLGREVLKDIIKSADLLSSDLYGQKNCRDCTLSGALSELDIKVVDLGELFVFNNLDDLLARLQKTYVVKIDIKNNFENYAKDYFVTSEDVLTCIKDNPSYYMGGNIGPDGFPDIFTGQMAIHGENLKNVLTNNFIDYSKLLKNTCDKFKNIDNETVFNDIYDECVNYIQTEIGITSNMSANKDNLKKLSKIPYKYRQPSFWRSIDWGQYLVEKATEPLYFRENGVLYKSNHPVWKSIDLSLNEQEQIKEAQKRRCLFCFCC